MEAYLNQFILEVKNTQALEWVAAVFGLISVLFAQQNHILLYPTGLVSTACYAYLLSRNEAGLYAEALLNVYYFVMTLYGWWHWLVGKNGQKDQLAISLNQAKDWWITIMMTLGLWILFYFLLLKTPSTVPIWDGFVSATACAGMWLLARRKLANWILLNLSNLIAIPLFAFKGYLITMVLTILLFIIAIFGYFNWRSIYLKNTAKAQ